MRRAPLIVAAALGCVAPALAQCEAQRLTRPVHEVPNFGMQMEIESDRLIVAAWAAWTGCPTPDPFSCGAGATYIYEHDEGQWAFSQIIVPPDIQSFDSFGAFNAHGDRMMISSARKNLGQSPGLIHDYRYDHASGQWVEDSRFEAHVSGPPDPSYPFVGRPSWSTTLLFFRFGDNIQRFVEDAEGWQYKETIVPPDPLVGTRFGDDIEVNDRWVVFNAPHDSTFGDRLGSVYVYRRNTDDSIEFFQKLLPLRGPGPGGFNRYFGESISLDGDRLAVGSVGVTDTVPGQGAAYVYSFDGWQWVLEQEVLQAEPRLGSNMGQSVDLERDVLIVGAQRRNDRHADVFRRGADGTWRQAAVLEPLTGLEPPVQTDDFGRDVATDGRLLTVSAPGERLLDIDKVPGAIYAYDLACFDCLPDLDADGTLTIFDFLTFMNLFDAGSSEADFDGDGELTIFDFLAFQDAFDAGCPE
ncbi:MAG: GC-type dockerin domain-anchored protein [Phycisphaerales bacterium JB060]